MNKKGKINKSLRRGLLGGTLGRSMSDLRSRGSSAKQLDTLSVDSFTCGETSIRKHKDGYPLASSKILKPLIHKNFHFSMFECDLASLEEFVEFEIKTKKSAFKKQSKKISTSSQKSSFLTSTSRKSSNGGNDADSSARFSSMTFADIIAEDPSQGKRIKGGSVPKTPKLGLKLGRGTGMLIVDNNFLQIFKGNAKKVSNLTTTIAKGGAGLRSRKFSWMHVYSVNSSPLSNEIEFVFYEGLDHGFQEVFQSTKKRVKRRPQSVQRGGDIVFSSRNYQFNFVKIKVKDMRLISKIKEQVFVAIKAQAQVCNATAIELASSPKPTQIARAGEFFRLSVDLWSLGEGCENKNTILSLNGLIKHLEGNEGDLDNKEIEFWKLRKKELEVSLERQQVAGNAVAGILL